jgi:hypothetical protein
MKKLIVSLVIMAGMVLMTGFSTPAQAQSPAIDLKPTFINPTPTPGLYVNGWPAFIVSYPKEWVEQHNYAPGDVLAVGGIRPDLPLGVLGPLLRIEVFGTVVPLKDWAKIFMPSLLPIFTDIKVLSDKPSQLKDGTPALEVEWEGILTYDATIGSVKDRPKLSNFQIMTKKDLAWVAIALIDDKKIGEDLKKVAYSLTFLPGREEPVNVPPDVRAFLDMYSVDWGAMMLRQS